MPTLLSFEDHADRYAGAVERFKLGEIGEADFRLVLGSLGFNATDIEAELKQVQQELEDGV